jgi:phage baseplate assembly protein W
MANGLGITYPLRLGNNGYFENTTDVMTQVKTNLRNLLLTVRGERMFQPAFGCDLPLVIFELQTDDGLADITAIIQTAVQNWMPFLRVNAVKVTRSEDTNDISVYISFTLLSNNITDSIVLVF